MPSQAVFREFLEFLYRTENIWLSDLAEDLSGDWPPSMLLGGVSPHRGYNISRLKTYYCYAVLECNNTPDRSCRLAEAFKTWLSDRSL